MICTRCGFNNREGSQFCRRCGQRIAFTTPGGVDIGSSLGSGMLLQGRYKMVRQLGKGGMGIVYLASDNRFSNRLCVVKEMLDTVKEGTERLKALERFYQEADLLAAINYPNVPQVYDRFNEGNRHYMVMEFIEGMDLFKLLNEYMKEYNTPLPQEDIAIFFMEICLTLKHIHNHRPVILHRDIKPSNIIITKTGKAKLVDFGIAKALQTNTQGTSIGTQGYAAPEQYKGLADNRTDIYALGATIHHLLTGRDPQMETPFDYPVVRQLNNNVSQGMSDIVSWMLNMAIDSRPQNIEEVIESVKKVFSGIEQKVLDDSAISNSIINIINKNSGRENNNPGNSNINAGNICPFCSFENNPDSRFCKRCGKPLPGSDIVQPQRSMKMIVPVNHKICREYPGRFNEYIKIPAKDGNLKINVVLERFFMDGSEFIYLTERNNYIGGQEVIVYNVVRNTQGVMQYIRPVSDTNVIGRLNAYWQQFLLR